MEGYEKKWRDCIEEDWTEWIGSKTLDFVCLSYVVLYGVITLVFICIILYMNTMHT